MSFRIAKENWKEMRKRERAIQIEIVWCVDVEKAESVGEVS